MGSHSRLQGIFPTQGWNPGVPHPRRILYQLSHQGSPQSDTVPTNTLPPSCYPSINPSVRPSVHLCIIHPVCPPVLSSHVSTHPNSHRPVCLSIHPSLHPLDQLMSVRPSTGLHAVNGQLRRLVDWWEPGPSPQHACQSSPNPVRRARRAARPNTQGARQPEKNRQGPRALESQGKTRILATDPRKGVRTRVRLCERGGTGPDSADMHAPLRGPEDTPSIPGSGPSDLWV